MEMKRGVIDSENYFREAFKPIIEPLSTRIEKNSQCNLQQAEQKNTETSSTSDKDDDKLNSSFENFLNNKRPTSQRYDKSYEDIESYYDILKTSRVHLQADGKPKTSGYFKLVQVIKPLYERMKNEEKQLNEEIAKIKTPRLNLTPINKHLSSSKPNSSMVIEPEVENMFSFTSTPQTDKEGSGLCKDVLPQGSNPISLL
eukprot:XP_016658702.1 PREDICTED: uncharacterized protein LOC107883366 [Acyrthosiphon pisum]